MSQNKIPLKSVISITKVFAGHFFVDTIPRLIYGFLLDQDLAKLDKKVGRMKGFAKLQRETISLYYRYCLAENELIQDQDTFEKCKAVILEVYPPEQPFALVRNHTGRETLIKLSQYFSESKAA